MKTDTFIDLYQAYIENYLKFASEKKQPVYQQITTSIFNSSKTKWLQIRAYQNLCHPNENSPSQSKRKYKFLIIPSIFNSPEIMFMSYKQNILSELAKYGEIYLIEWDLAKAPPDLQMSDLALAAIELANKNKLDDTHLVGHCIGGNIALAVAILQEKTKSVTFLTSPWDFSHFRQIASWQLSMLPYYLANLRNQHIPALYVQIMFFMLNPENIFNIIEKYNATDSNSQTNYLLLQKWLFSGQDMPRTLYQEILQDLCINNKLHNNQWLVNDQIINPQNLRPPSCMIRAQNDKIVSHFSTIALQNSLENCKIIEASGGHVSYLLKCQPELNAEYAAWLKEIIEFS
jgi:polyhydroxyalkanoate synthase